MSREVRSHRLLSQGSFATAKPEPNDVDSVVLLPVDFEHQIQQGFLPAIELEGMLLSRRPEEIFAAENKTDWQEWVTFFSRTRETDGC